MRSLVLTLVLLAGGVAVAWLALRTPQAEPPSSVVGMHVAETSTANVEAPVETSEAIEVTTDEQREAATLERDDRASELSTAETATRSSDTDRVRIRVLDGATGQPIERFGARVCRRLNSERRIEGVKAPALQLEAHGDGRANLLARTRDEVLQVEAPGFMPLEALVLAEARDDGVQTVELARGASVVGRVVLDGAPAASVKVRLGRMKIPTLDRSVRGAEMFDLSLLSGRTRTSTTTREGAFAFDDLAPGTYELELMGSDGSRGSVAPVEVKEPTRIDLGDTELTSGAALRGQALLPEGVSAKGVRIVALADGRAEGKSLDAFARFEFDRLPAGSCSLTIGEQPSRLVDGQSFDFELVAGETREVVLDLRDRAGMWIQARVTAGHRALGEEDLWLFEATGVYVSSSASISDTSRIESHSSKAVEGASWRWWQARTERIQMRLRSKSNDMPLGRFERDVVLLPNGEGLVEIELELAELRVEWQRLEVPAEAKSIDVVVRLCSDMEVSGDMSLHNPALLEDEQHKLAERALDLGPLLAERYEVSLVFRTGSRELQDDVVKRVGDIAFKRTLELQPGERAVCTFTDADRVE